MIKNKYVAFGIFVVCSVVLWNLLDYIYNVIITKSAFHFAFSSNLLLPLSLAIVAGYLFYLRND